MPAPLCQIAISVTDLPRTHAWYTGAFGFAPASGTNSFKGYLAEKVQGVKGAASSCWWLVDREEFFQLELFQFHNPETRRLPADWRLCDIGYSAMGLVVRDWEETLARLHGLGSLPVGPVVGDTGHRRICVRDPEGVLVELFESDPREKPGNVVRDDIPVAAVSITLSVPDLEKSLAFFASTLGLELLEGFQLHGSEHEVLWGLQGATARRAVLRAGDRLLELVQYENPVGRTWPDDYRISDQGLLNIALGFRKRGEFKRVYRNCRAHGVEGNWRPLDLGAWQVVYVNDPQGFSVELLQVQPWYDGRMGFTRRRQAPALPVGGLRSLCVEHCFAVSAETLKDSLSERECIPGWYPTRDQRATLTLLPSGDNSIAQWRIRFRPLIPGTGRICHWLLHKRINRVAAQLQKQLQTRLGQTNN